MNVLIVVHISSNSTDCARFYIFNMFNYSMFNYYKVTYLVTRIKQDIIISINIVKSLTYGVEFAKFEIFSLC